MTTAPTYETLRFEVDAGGVGTLTLSRPDALNAFDLTMARELLQFFSVGDARDDAVRAIVVTGEGKAFCAGMDLSAEGNVFGLDEDSSPPRRRSSGPPTTLRSPTRRVCATPAAR